MNHKKADYKYMELVSKDLVILHIKTNKVCNTKNINVSSITAKMVNIYEEFLIMAHRAIPMIAFPRVRCMFIYIYIYIYICVTYASMGCIRS